MSGEVEPVRESLHEIFRRAREAVADDDAPDLSGSPFADRAIFLVGAPRSGTTWLQQLLALHPEVATSGESHVFPDALVPLFANHEDPDPTIRLSTWISRPHLVSLVRRFVDYLFQSMRDAVRPEATHVLDKTPSEVEFATVLGEVYPDASFVHIVRDARDMAGSAHDLWSWHPKWTRFPDIARVWVDAIEDIRRHLSSRRYLEVRYEDLLAAPEDGLEAILDFLHLPRSPKYVSDAVEFGRAPINVRPSDDRTGSRKWSSLPPGAEWEVVSVAGDLMVDLGYLTAAERRARMLRPHPRALLRAGTDRLRRLARAAREASARRDFERRRRRWTRSRDLGRALVEGVIGGDQQSVASLLTRDVEADTPGGVARAPEQVAERLRAELAGSSIVRVEADERAAAVSITDADGVRRLVRVWVDGDAVNRVVVQGGSDAVRDSSA